MIVLLILLGCIAISIPLGMHMAKLYGDEDPFINRKNVIVNDKV